MSGNPVLKTHWLETRLPAPVGFALMWVAMHFVPVVEATDGWALPQRVFMDLGYQLSALSVIAAMLAFMRSRTTINPLHPERASVLVTDGIYRYSRNPMYLSLLLLLLGHAFEIWNWPAFAGPLLYAAYMTRFQIWPEERILAQLFGEDYLRYKKRVRRWL